MPAVNLWELITAVASNVGGPNSERCEEIMSIQTPRFGTELTLEINERGTWTIVVFDHEDTDRRVKLEIQSDGSLTITRCRAVGDIYETRTVAF